jgi:two-component system invasion response regulator UvrY
LIGELPFRQSHISLEESGVADLLRHYCCNKNKTAMYKIVIAEDNKVMRNWLFMYCQSLGWTVLFLAVNGLQLEEYLSASEANSDPLPDIILMDISMPVINGIAATAFVSAHFPFIRVIALSLYVQEKPIIDVLRNGAKGYLDKNNMEPEDILSAADAAMNNEMYFSPSVLKEWQIPPACLKSGYHKNYRTFLLSNREYEFLSHCGTDMEYKEIADRMGVTLHTVNNYSTAVFEKLNIHTRAGLTAYAVKHGLTEIYQPEC